MSKQGGRAGGQWERVSLVLGPGTMIKVEAEQAVVLKINHPQQPRRGKQQE